MIFSSLRAAVSALSGQQAGLEKRVLRGGMWLIVADVASRGINLIKLGIFARLLSPQDFGLIGLATLLLGWFEYFSQTGFSAALVRKQQDIQPYLNTLWTVQAFRGLLLAAAVFAGAPWIASIFNNAELTLVIRVSSPMLILNNLANPAVVHLRKQLKVEREVLWRMGGSVVGLIVGVPFALSYRNVWALIISMLAGTLAELLLSYLLLPFRPRIELHWAKAREMMRFGKWVFWSNIAAYLNRSADIWVIGRYLGTTAVGYYQFAQQLGATPLDQVGSHIGTVAFPAFSARMDRKDALRAGFLRSVRFVSTAVWPLAALIATFAPTLVRVALGERWMPVSPLLRMLACSSGLIAVGAVMRALLLASDRPHLATYGIVLRVLSFAVLVFPLMRRFDAPGVALAVLISSPVSALYLYYHSIRLLGWGWDLVLVFRLPLIACLPCLAVAVLLPYSPGVWATAAVGVLAVGVYAFLFLRQLRLMLV